MDRLALAGGSPVRGGRAWPRWPEIDSDTDLAILRAVRSRRWTISWPSDGREALERQFAREFARYHDARFCIAVDHGSSALVLALEALDIGPGDEVIVPDLTWVATATAVLRVGALPVLADVDPDSGCLLPDCVRAALSERTRAVIAVHLGSTVADIDGLLEITAQAGIPLVEDCAQAHGASWRGRMVGTWGAVGAFSFQNGKVLTGGEGGAVIVDDELLYRRCQQLRADSRTYSDGQPSARAMELVETGEVMGANYCLSELNAALLLDQLPRLDAQHARREKLAAELESGLAEMEGIWSVPLPPNADRRSIYEFGIRFAPGIFGSASVERVAQAVAAELQCPVFPPDAPLHRNVLFRPGTKRRFSAAWTAEGARRAAGRDYPNAERFCESTILLPHWTLLGDSSDAADILTALDKVRAGLVCLGG